tara:strand:+ start:55 stop:534 length:480 start_codon:yes stop_codon:yes gene_type:complete
MKNIYKSFFIFALFLLCACGYSPLYKMQKKNFNIAEIQSNNKNNYYYLLKNSLKPYTKDNQTDLKNVIIIASLSKDKKILSKDTKGNPLVYSLEIILNMETFHNDNLILNKTIRKKFKYNHKSEVFDLNRYEENIEKNLIKSISDDLIFLISKSIEENY